MRTCPRCRERQIWTEFYKRGDSRGKEYGLCKTCRCKYQKNYYKLHREECLNSSKKSNEQLRLDVLQHYSSLVPHCTICGESDFLVLNLDHTNGGGEQHRRAIGKSGLPFYRWIRQRGYPAGYQVLCANCNTRKWKQQLGGIK